MNKILTATQARADIYKLINDVSEGHQAITITGKTNNAVLISERDWNSIQETLYLDSIPGMRESIKEGMETPLPECTDKPEW